MDGRVREDNDYLKYFKKIFEYQKSIIDRNILIYVIVLLMNIFFKSDKKEQSKKVKKKLIDMNSKINKEIIKDENKYIYNFYTKDNLMNILDFVKSQNSQYAGDILEYILIFIFSKAFKTDKTNTFGKYIFNNLSKIKDSNDLPDWFEQAKYVFDPEELQDIQKLLIIDTFMEEPNANARIADITANQRDSPFLNFMYQIVKNKYNVLFQTKNKKNKVKCYINKGEYECHENGQVIYDKINKDDLTKSSMLEKDHNLNSLFNFYNRLVGKEQLNSFPIRIIRSFLISVYIYYQNKNSPLIKPLDIDSVDKKFRDICLESVPFVYDLNGACIEGRFANLVIAPLRLEPRIHKINIHQNNLKETALFEVGKTLIFNKNIKKIDYNISLIKAFFLDYINYGLGLFDNYSIEEMNLSYNYIKEEGDFYLAKLLSHLKGLKTINLTSNEIKAGMASFFIMLKKLYRSGKSNVENIYLIRCALDDTSLYELGELLKCKYCKLKTVYLSINNKPKNFNLLKKIKKNRSLVEINFSRSTYGINDVDDINRLISNTDLKHLSFFRNRINDFSDCIRIIYRTKLIKGKEEKDNPVDNNISLLNLDLSSNDPWNQFIEQVHLINKIVDESTLGCLDISHILLGPNPDKGSIQGAYRKAVEEILNKLTDYKKKHELNMKEKKSLEGDVNRFKVFENDKVIEEIRKTFEKEIDDAIKDKNSMYPVYLKQKAKEIKNKINKEENKEIKNEILNIMNDKEQKEFDKIVMEKIVNYMIFRRAKNELININKKLDEKKLIII